MNRALVFWASLAPSFIAVAGLVLQAEWRLAHGVEVRLEVRPYDPMDALSGRYLAVPLVMDQLDPALLQREFHFGESVWVQLEQGEPWWSPVAVLERPPAQGVALRGTVLQQTPSALWVDFGLGRFYIPQTGADPTLAPGEHELVAVVKITPAGHGQLVDLLVDGQPWRRWSEGQTRGQTR
jgi:uncharacterized membrane-anchored protein